MGIGDALAKPRVKLHVGCFFLSWKHPDRRETLSERFLVVNKAVGAFLR